MEKYQKNAEGLASYSPIIIVSNRLPFKVQEENDVDEVLVPSSGGLVSALLPVMRRVGGTWIGSLGGKDLDDYKMYDFSLPKDGYRLRCVTPSKNLFDIFYNDICNGCLWPLFHSMPSKAIFFKNQDHCYEEVNMIFAQNTLSELSRSYSVDGEASRPVVWIQDFHLLLLPTQLRELIDNSTYNCRILFFLHIPFPPKDILCLLPWHTVILKSLLLCDLVGFQTHTDLCNFIGACSSILKCQIHKNEGKIFYQGHSCRVGAYPIAISYDYFSTLAANVSETKNVEPYKTILGVDRLDYTKGLLEKLKAYERFLEENSCYREKVVLVQIAVPSRENVWHYKNLKYLFDQEVGRINGRFSTLSWTPIKYLYGCLSPLDLCSLYKRSHVAAVTPIRDGMNLVAKEFVACQGKDPGVLILSKFAGSAETMAEAILVDPLQEKELSNAFLTALEMKKEERQRRMYSLKSREKSYDVFCWFKTFMDTAVSLGEKKEKSKIYITKEKFQELLRRHVSTKQDLCLLLDYDGTLAPIADRPEEAILPQYCLEVLTELTDDPYVHIAIISGRSLEDLKNMVRIKGITYAGNHGLDIVKANGESFLHPQAKNSTKIVDRVCGEINNNKSIEGGWTENKQFSLAFHYRNIKDVEQRARCVENVTKIIQKSKLTLKRGKFVIEGIPYCNWNKGDASLFILNAFFGKEWSTNTTVISIGDDITDEDSFTALKNKALTFKVDSGNEVPTAADFKLQGPNGVWELLKWVSTRNSF